MPLPLSTQTATRRRLDFPRPPAAWFGLVPYVERVKPAVASDPPHLHVKALICLLCKQCVTRARLLGFIQCGIIRRPGLYGVDTYGTAVSWIVCRLYEGPGGRSCCSQGADWVEIAGGLSAG